MNVAHITMKRASRHLPVRFLTLCVSLLAIAIISGCGGAKHSSSSGSAASPVISSFSASATTITSGGSTTLSWSVSNATSVSIDNGIGKVTGSSVSVSPSGTTTYTLTAKNAAGTASIATLTITVETAAAAPFITSFSASNSSLAPVITGVSSTTLSWMTTNATTLSIDNGIGNVTGNSVTVSPTATTTYTLTAVNLAGDSVTAKTTVYVRNQLAVLAGLTYSGDIEICSVVTAVASDSNGNLYIADHVNNNICKITTAGVVTLIASNATSTLSSSMAQDETRSASSLKSVKTLSPHSSSKPLQLHEALMKSTTSSTTINANLNSPEGIAVSSDGKTIYVADSGNHAIRKIVIADDGTSSISTLAGIIGTSGTSDGVGTFALFSWPVGLALDGSEALYVADSTNDTIRRIALSTGAVTTLAGKAETAGSADGTGSSARFDAPLGVAIDSSKNLYVADTNNNTIRSIAISTATDGTVTASVTTLVGSAGNKGTTDGAGSTARFNMPYGLTLSSNGKTLYVADSQNSTIRKVALTGSGTTITATVSTLAGTAGTYGQADGLGTAAWFNGPSGVALDASGNLFVADGDGYGSSELESYIIRKINLSTSEVSSPVINIFGSASGSTDGAGKNAFFVMPTRMAADGSGNLYVADTINNTIRKIAITRSSDGSVSSTVSTLAGTAGLYGHADGTGSNARFSNPIGVVVDSNSNYLYVSDWANNTIRKIDLSSGAVTTVAGKAGSEDSIDGIGNNARFEAPQGLALDSSGNLYVAEDGSGVIRKIVLSTGEVTTLSIVDGSGKSISTIGSNGLAAYTNNVTGKSYLYVSSKSNCSILQLDLLTLVATTLAGSSTCGHADGTGTTASFEAIWDIATDKQGNLYIEENSKGLIRRITPAGVVTTIVGTYGSVSTTTGALPSTLNFPMGVVVDSSDNLYITVPNAVLTLEP